jgi:hypothetical protein
VAAIAPTWGGCRPVRGRYSSAVRSARWTARPECSQVGEELSAQVTFPGPVQPVRGQRCLAHPADACHYHQRYRGWQVISGHDRPQGSRLAGMTGEMRGGRGQLAGAGSRAACASR